MAIAFDHGSSGQNSGASITVSHTCTGSDRILIVSVDIADTGDTVTVSGVTYNGVAMTQIATSLVTARRGYLFYLVAPSTGANNIVATLSGTPSAWGRVNACSYTGAAQTGQPDAFNSGTNASATSLTVSVTTVADNCVLVGPALGSGGQVISAGTSTQIRNEFSGAEEPDMLESSAAITPAGSASLTYTIPSAAAMNLIVASIAPAVSGPTNMKTWDGLATASIKTMDGLAIGSVKTWNGLT